MSGTQEKEDFSHSEMVGGPSRGLGRGGGQGSQGRDKDSSYSSYPLESSLQFSDSLDYHHHHMIPIDSTGSESSLLPSFPSSLSPSLVPSSSAFPAPSPYFLNGPPPPMTSSINSNHGPIYHISHTRNDSTSSLGSNHSTSSIVGHSPYPPRGVVPQETVYPISIPFSPSSSASSYSQYTMVRIFKFLFATPLPF